MSKLELFFTVLFIVGTGITVFLIYLYNTRHEDIENDEFEDFEVATKDEKALYESSDKFKWNLCESDIAHQYGDFVGLTDWQSKESANRRIEKLKISYEKDERVVKLNMLETLMFVEMFGDNIILDASGVYRAQKIYIDKFINEIVYDIAMIDLIEELKDEISFTIEKYEIDAKKIFFIMKNAKSLGLNNFDSHSHVFLFSKNINNKTIDFSNSNQNSTDREIDVYVDESFNVVENNSEEENSEEENSERDHTDIFDAFKSLMSKTKIYYDDDKNRITEYANGQKVIKKNLWEVDVKEDEETSYKNNGKPANYSSAIKEESVDSIMKGVEDKAEVKITTKKQKEEKVIIEIKEEEPFIINNFINNLTLIDDSRNKNKLIGYFGKINSLEDFKKCLNSLSDKNIRLLLICLLTISSATINKDNEDVSMLIESGGDFYLNYDFIGYLLLLMIKNRGNFSVKNKFVSESGFISYPSELIGAFIDFLKSDDISFAENKPLYKYVSSDKNFLISASFLKLSKGSVNMILKYNTSIQRNNIVCSFISKDEFIKSKKNKYKINYKTIRE